MNKHIIPLLALERDEPVSLLDVEPFLRAAEWKVMVSRECAKGTAVRETLYL